MPAIDVPPQQMQERIVCSITAAVRYDIPANIVLAIAEKEGGKPGQWVKNPNGTHDVGPMQFNTSYLKALAQYGITPDDVANTGCYPYELAAWRLAGHIAKDRGDIWTRVANYHSRTPYYNGVYRADLMVKANKWADWLEVYLKNSIASGTEITQTPIATTQELIIKNENPAIEIKSQKEPSQTQPVKVSYTAYIPRKIVITTMNESDFSR